jgi:hypothetical protein
MTGMVQVALAEGVTEAEEIRDLLTAAGIDTQVEPAVEHPSEVGDLPQKILVPEGSLDDALEVIDGMVEPEEPADF